MTRTDSSKKASFHWDDPLLLNSQLTDDERMVRDAAAAYCQDKLQPRILEAFRHEVRTVARLHHPGVVMVFDCGMVGPEAMEQSETCRPDCSMLRSGAFEAQRGAIALTRASCTVSKPCFALEKP